jgi:dolichol-phosphate mannosyltransferase
MRRAAIVPVYNEKPTVPILLRSLRESFDGLVVVVDDGSNDGGVPPLEGDPEMVVLRSDRNAGYGAAILRGIAHADEAGAEAVVTIDADLQHRAEDVPRFFAALADGVDIVSGSRFLPASGVVGSQPVERREVNLRILEVINQTTGWGLTDAFCGIKAYKMAALRRMKLRESGYGFNLELWARAFRAGLTIRELAVDRIYLESPRGFPGDLAQRDVRLRYYLKVWEDSLNGA